MAKRKCSIQGVVKSLRRRDVLNELLRENLVQRTRVSRAWKKFHSPCVNMTTKELLLLKPVLERVTDDLSLLGDQAEPLLFYLSNSLDSIKGYLKARGK